MKTNFKRLGAIFLTLMIAILAMAVPFTASADGEYTIKIYKYDYNGDILPTTDQTEANRGDLLNGVTFNLYPASYVEDTTYATAKTVAGESDNMQVYINPDATPTSAVTGTVEDGIATFANLNEGLYYIEEVISPAVKANCAPFAVYISSANTTNGVLEIHPKNILLDDTITIAKTVRKSGTTDNFGETISVNNGEEVEWQFKTKIPLDMYGSTKYEITDILAQEFIYDYGDEEDPIFVISYNNGNGTLTKGADYTETYNETTRELKLSLTTTGINTIAMDIIKDYNTNQPAYKDNIDQNITITFKTKVHITGHSEVNKEIENTAAVTYTNDIGQTKTDDDTASVFNGWFKIEKVDSANTNNKLKDAEFEIYTVKNDKGEYTDPVQVYKGGEWTTLTVTTDKDGIAIVEGVVLEAGKTYYLKETKAPNGYTIDSEFTELAITEEDSLITEQITNTRKEFKLPVTGGSGTILFTILGLLFIGGSITLFVLSNKKSKSKKK